MRIQKKDNGLYQSKLALTSATSNASSIVTLNSDIQTINNVISPISGSVNALSGNIVTLNNNVTTVSGNLITLSNNTDFFAGYIYNQNPGFSTNSTSTVQIGSYSYTKKSGTNVIITVTFAMRTGSFTSTGGSSFAYSVWTPTSWFNLGSVDYKVLNTSQTSQFVAIDNRTAGTYTFRFGMNVALSTSTVYIDNYSIVIQEIA